MTTRMSDEEWLAAYLMRFGTATVANVEVQQGEPEWLNVMGEEIRAAGDRRSAWYVIRTTYQKLIYKQEK